MGWDCVALRRGKPLQHDKAYRLINPILRKAFEDMSETILKKYGSVDGGFKSGILDLDYCGRILQHYTGINAWSHEVYYADYLIYQWNHEKDPLEDAPVWAVESTLAFLKICREHELAISFTY